MGTRPGVNPAGSLHRWAKRSGHEPQVVVPHHFGHDLEQLGSATGVEEVLDGLAGNVGSEEVAGLGKGGHRPIGVNHVGPLFFGGGGSFDGAVAVLARIEERVVDEVGLVSRCLLYTSDAA